MNIEVASPLATPAAEGNGDRVLSVAPVDPVPDIPELPEVELPTVPEASLLWTRTLTVGLVILCLYLLDRLTFVFMNCWLLERLGYGNVFWTNFWTGVALWASAFVAYAGAVVVPAYVHKISPEARGLVIRFGLIAGLVAGSMLCVHYLDYLLMFNGKPFGKTEPVFNLDLGFYVFVLHGIFDTWTAALYCTICGILSSIGCAAVAHRGRPTPPGMSRFSALFGFLGTRCTLAMLGACGVVTAVGVWLQRFCLLTQDNTAGMRPPGTTKFGTSVYTGATYIDVTGFFSYLNDYYVTTGVCLIVTGALVYLMRQVYRAATGEAGVDWRRAVRRGVWTMVGVVAFDFVFLGLVALRQLIFVTPNQPVIQLEYIRRHIDATWDGYDFDKIEQVSFKPKKIGDPMPKTDELLKHPTMKNVPLWPGYVSYLESLVDPQHADRIIQSKGDKVVYGPTMEVFQNQQKLRPYYYFLDVDTLRYRIDGEPRMLVSAVREIPLLEPYPWLAYWGQTYMLFTHGHGMVMADVGKVNSEGEPVYVQKAIPGVAKYPELQIKNEAVYYGEGAGTVAYSNIRQMKELDYPTEEGRAEVVMKPDQATGVRIDSLLKRLVFGWRTGNFFEVLFSRLIDDDTHVHYFRTPIERVEQVAPFLYYDSDPFAFPDRGGITWMVNAMTTTDEYPYSRPDYAGDKSDERSPFPRPHRWVNYIRDTVKATVNAYDGRVTLYQIANEPIVDTWAGIYPGLFTPGDQMPSTVREQLQYPVQLFHIQFDDLYMLYHMKDPMTFFNMEDKWDDADEVLGAMGVNQVMFSAAGPTGKAITFSNEPYLWFAETGKVLPKSDPGVQFALSMAFTPAGAKNLRAIPTCYQDGKDYGRLMCLTVPKGEFYPGPEQADAAMDQDPDISQQFGWWQRQGTDVVRGHTSLLLIGDEVIYVEPVFIRSQQNPLPQIKKITVVFRGKARMGDSFEQALRLAMKAAAAPNVPESRAATMQNSAPAMQGNDNK